MEIPAAFVQDDSTVLEVWQRDESLVANLKDRLLKYDGEKQMTEDIWRALSASDLLLLDILIRNLTSKFFELPDCDSIELSRQLGAWLHRQRDVMIEEPSYRYNRDILFIWDNLDRFLQSDASVCSNRQQIFQNALLPYQEELEMLKRRMHETGRNVNAHTPSNRIAFYREQQQALHSILNEFLDRSSHFPWQLKQEIFQSTIRTSFLLWYREHLELIHLSPPDRKVYYKIPQELSINAIQKLASPRIVSKASGGWLIKTQGVTVPKSQKNLITLSEIDVLVSEFAKDMHACQEDVPCVPMRSAPSSKTATATP